MRQKSQGARAGSNVAAAEAKEKALSYARERFGGRAGEVHVYDDAGSVIEQTIPIDGRERRCSAQPDGVPLIGKAASSASGG